MNFADVMNTLNIFVEAEHETCPDLLISTIEVDVDEIYRDAFGISFLREFDCLL